MRLLSTCVLAVVAGAFIIGGGGCADSKLVAQRDGLATQNKELAAQLRAESEARQLAEQRAAAHDAALTTAITETPAIPEMGEPLVLNSGPRPAKANVPVKAATTKVKIPGQVLFASGRTSLDAAGTKALDSIAATIKSKYPGEKLVLEGYTDATPPSKTSVWKSNEEIAQARATAVKKYLVKKGVAEGDITIKALGAVSSESSKSAAQRRRVEIAVMTTR